MAAKSHWTWEYLFFSISVSSSNDWCITFERFNHEKCIISIRHCFLLKAHLHGRHTSNHIVRIKTESGQLVTSNHFIISFFRFFSVPKWARSDFSDLFTITIVLNEFVACVHNGDLRDNNSAAIWSEKNWIEIHKTSEKDLAVWWVWSRVKLQINDARNYSHVWSINYSIEILQFRLECEHIDSRVRSVLHYFVPIPCFIEQQQQPTHGAIHQIASNQLESKSYS